MRTLILTPARTDKVNNGVRWRVFLACGRRIERIAIVDLIVMDVMGGKPDGQTIAEGRRAKETAGDQGRKADAERARAPMQLYAVPTDAPELQCDGSTQQHPGLEQSLDCGRGAVGHQEGGRQS